MTTAKEQKMEKEVGNSQRGLVSKEQKDWSGLGTDIISSGLLFPVKNVFALASQSPKICCDLKLRLD